MLFYGVGNHGGGPTKANIDSIHSMDTQGDMPAIKMSGTAAFFDTVPTEDLPVYQGDLQHHAPGCYSVNSRVKRDNLRAEQCLLSAERWSALAKALGYLDYPATELKQGWKNALFNQFHDILAGTSIPSAYDDSGYSFGEAINRGAHSLNSAVQAISWDIDIPAENNMRPIVVFNPHPWAARLPVELEIRGLGDDKFRLLDENGAPIPAQRIPSEATVTDQSRLLFVVDMPSLGYRTFRLYMKLDIAPQYEPVAVSDTVLENDTLRVEFNSATGGMNHLVDKRLGIEVLGREGGRLSVISDTSDTWSHDIAKFDQEIAVMQPLYVRKLEEGPVRSAIRVRSQYKDSYVTQDFRLYKDLDRVEVFTVIDWREEQTMLKLKYAGKSNFRSPTYEIPYGFLEKSANGEEEPGQGWIDMTGEHPSGCMYGLALANDRKFGYSIAVDEMAITLLKNSVYAHHNPKELVRGHEYRFIERGIQELTYALFPHSGNWRDHALSKRAAELKQRSIAVPETCHPGALPQKNEFLRADRGEIMLTVLKEAEDGDGFILRGVETTGNRVETVISLPPLSREFSTVFSPCEIKTIKIPSTASLPVAEVNMLELPV
jgi:alpha-mannosidase